MTAPSAHQLPAPTDDLDRAEHDLRTHGICAVSDAMDAHMVATARATIYAAAEADRQHGTQTTGFALDPDTTNQRVWNLPGRAPVFMELAEHPTALRLLKSVLGWPMLLGNLSGNITGPGGVAGHLHADQIFVPQPWPAAPQGANAAWCIDDFTEENGATRFVPGSHLYNRMPTAGDDLTSVPLEAPAGSVVVFDSRLWHQTGANTTTDRTRAAAFGWYTRPIYRTQENWFLALDPSVQHTASDDLLVLLGYRTAGLGLVHGRSPV